MWHLVFHSRGRAVMARLKQIGRKMMDFFLKFLIALCDTLSRAP